VGKKEEKIPTKNYHVKTRNKNAKKLNLKIINLPNYKKNK